MQSAHFDGTGTYAGSMYASSMGFEPGSLKLPTTYDVDCYQSYMGLQYPAWRDPQSCRDPPAYTENNFLHTCPNYYKPASRHVPEYTMPAAQDSFLMKPGEPADVYNDQQLPHQHLSHHITHQSVYGNDQDLSKLNTDSYAKLASDAYQKLSTDTYGSIKSEPMKTETSHAEYDTSASLVSTSLAAPSTSLPHPPQAQSSIHQSSNPDLINPNLSPPNPNCELSNSQSQTNTEPQENQTNGETTKEDNNNKDGANGTSGKDDKPTMSYIALIAKAILESEQRRLNLGAIYGWIEKHFPFYKTKGQGWRNSVRHNLSLNDCFIKAGRCEDGKGNYWAIHPANLQDFIRGDFRQRRRSRRRGRKKECDLNMYHVTNGYLPTASSTLNPAMTFNPSALSSIYSPYTEAERRAYRLDEALLRQSMNNPFVKWYQSGVPTSGTPTYGAPSTPPVGPCGGNMYPSSGSTGVHQWPQAYSTETTGQSVAYPALNSTFTR